MRIARILIAFLIYFLLAPADFAQGFGKAVNDGAGDYAGELARFHGASVGNLLKKSDLQPFAVSFFGWRALAIARLPFNKLEGTHLDLCRLGLGIYDKELDATLQALAARPTAMLAFVEATPAEKEAIQKFVVRKYGGMYVMPVLSSQSATQKRDETAAWKYDLGASLGELAGSVVKWYAFPNNAKYDENISDLLRGLDKAIKNAPKDAPPDLLTNLKQLMAFGNKRLFTPDERQQIGAAIRQTLMTTLAFAKPLSPGLENFASTMEKMLPAKPATAAPAPANDAAKAEAARAKEIARQYLQEGIKKVDAKMYDPAIDDFNHAAEIDPNNHSIYFNRARAYYQKALYDNAIADFTRAINLDGVNADDYFAMTFRAMAEMRKGALDAALADLNQALAFGVQQDHAYFVRGMVYKNKGDLAHARADFQAALQINPNNQPAKNALAALGQ
jgi:tetratricopeptide (TPR) repeat protein